MLPFVSINGHENDIPGSKLTEAYLPPRSLAWLESLPTCDTFGVPGYVENDRCFVLQSPAQGDDYVAFDALISYRIH